MPRFLDATGYIFIVTEVVFLLILCTNASVPFSSDDEEETYHFPTSEPVFFYDSKILPENYEVSAYLFYNTTERVFFVPEENNTPIYITIKPCASAVEWTVVHKSISLSYADDSEEDSSDATANSLHTTQKPVTRVLQHYSGREAFTFKQDSGEKGLYTINITAFESDTIVHFYGTNRPFPEKQYPSLPKDTSIKQKKVSKKSIVIEWESSPDETPFDNIIEYYVAVNRKRSYDTFCSLMSHLKGDRKPKPPKYSGFGFRGERAKNKELREKANPIKPVKKGEILTKSVGTKTRFTFNGARPGRKYYFNVYAINKSTNKTSAYKSIAVRTKKGQKLKRIKDGKMESFMMRKPKQKYTYRYKLNKQAKLYVALHPCTGPVKIQIRTKTSRVYKSVIKDMKSIVLPNLKKDKYSIRVTNLKKGRQNVRLLVTSKIKKFQYPKLPNDTRLIELNSTCTNVTIAWLGETEKQIFCIYKTEISSSIRKKRRRGSYDQCVTDKDKNSELITCKRFRHRRPLLQETITGLKPNTYYRFDVHVKRRGKRSASLRYEELYTQTKSGC